MLGENCVDKCDEAQANRRMSVGEIVFATAHRYFPLKLQRASLPHNLL